MSSNIMWALRRASTPLRNQGYKVGTSDTRAKLEIPNTPAEDKPCVTNSSQAIYDGFLNFKRSYHIKSVSLKCYVGSHHFSTQAGAKSSGQEDELEDGFSELETPLSAESIESNTTDDEIEDELISEPELSDDADDAEEASPNELDLLETETDESARKPLRRRAYSELCKVITDCPVSSIHSVLDKWVEEGKELSRESISLAMLNLRKRRQYGRALQLSEWLEANKKLEFILRDYVARLDLIAKVVGLQKAEDYIERIPKSFRNEVVYRTLLANCVYANNLKKAEEVFNKMRDLEFPITSFACNQLILLYKRLDKKKLADILLLMEKENVEPSPFTYKMLIDVKGQSNDMTGMDQIVETMKAQGIEPDINTKAILAKHYASGGLKDRSKEILKEIEGKNLSQNRWACRILLPLYADLGIADEVERFWKICELNPQLDESMSAIIAFGKLKNIKRAEEIFDIGLKTSKKLPSVYFYTMLKVYADNKMLNEGKNVIKRMADMGIRIDALTWDALVKLYVEAGEVEKADSVLQKAAQQKQMKLLFNSYMTIMDHYAKRGDVHNSEKMLHRMRRAGYSSRIRLYQTLLDAYIRAKVPLYGIRERMKADNVFPNRSLAAQLAQVDPFRKTALSDLLD